MAGFGMGSLGSPAHAGDAPPVAEAPAKEDLSFGAVEHEGQPAVRPPPRRQLDSRFDVGLHGRFAEKSGPEFVENRRKERVYRDPERRFRATLHPDGRLSFRNRGMNFRNQRIMGVSDLVLMGQGAELHQSAKRALLRETYQDRLAMRVEWTLGNLEHAEQQLWHELKEIWYDESKSVQERKRIILQRWAECDVDVDLTPVGGTVSLVDQERRKVARRAQRSIEHFVRLHVDDQGPLQSVTTEHLVHLGGDATTAQLVRVDFAEEDGFNFHGALGASRGEPAQVDPRHELAVSAAPDLFEECERDPAACVSVGDMLVGRRANAFDAEQGAQYYGRACDAGDPWACYELAVLHYLGLGVDRDDRTAARLHRVACDGGVAEGCAYLAHLHRKGLGVAESTADAAYYRRRACERGLDDYCRS
jgi:hypothetical protein